MINRFGRLKGRIVLSLVVFLAIPLLGWNAFPKFMLDTTLEIAGQLVPELCK